MTYKLILGNDWQYTSFTNRKALSWISFHAVDFQNLLIEAHPTTYIYATHFTCRLNCQKAAMCSLRLARNHSTSTYERLVYEGWILYDTGHREEALAKAEESISLQRSFEAFFLKAYALADSTLDSESSSYVIRLLEEALKCPSDGLRKGQVGHFSKLVLFLLFL